MLVLSEQDLRERTLTYLTTGWGIYSAYRPYVIGELLAQMGDPALESYRAETGISKVTFRCADRAEIIVAVADYSHSYSGMVYPPAFGELVVVESILNTRFAVCCAAIALSLGIGLFCFGIWLILSRDRSDRNPLPLYYAALCLCFALFIFYPVIKTLWTSGMGWYSLERLAYPGLLLLVTLIQSRVCGITGLPAKLMAALGIFTCGFSLAVPFVMDGSLGMMMVYSHLLTAFTWLTDSICWPPR